MEEVSFCQNLVEGPMHGVGKRLMKTLDWEWIHRLLSSQKFSNIWKVYLEAGLRNGLLPASYAIQDEVHVQLSGRRRYILVSPSNTFEGMYPYPTAHPYDKFAMPNLERIDDDAWPGLKNVKMYRAVIGPGDLMFVPSYWSIHVQDLEEQNITLRISLISSKRVPSREGTLVRVSRAIEERVANVVGISDVKRWLQIIAGGNETRHLDLSTVNGYKRARMCQDIREEMESSLGEGSWSKHLPSICQNRLVPTPWLNKNFREPLLLTDSPVRIEDTRTDEEKKYPTLFRQKLEKEGWHVEPTKSTVPIPGVNIPENVDYRTI